MEGATAALKTGRAARPLAEPQGWESHRRKQEVRALNPSREPAGSSAGPTAVEWGAGTIKVDRRVPPESRREYCAEAASGELWVVRAEAPGGEA